MGAYRPFLLLFWANKKVAKTRVFNARVTAYTLPSSQNE